MLTFATLYAGWRKGYHSLFDKICNVYLIFVLLHTIYALVVRLCFGAYSLLDVSAPFVLCYGPFFLIGFKSLTEEKFKKQDGYLHFLPFILFLVIYIAIISSVKYREKYLMSFYILQYAYVAISLLGYAFWVLLYRQDVSNNGYLKESRQLIKTSGYSLLLMAVIFVIVVLVNSSFTNFLKITLPALVIYSGIFMSVIFAFIFTINNMVNNKGVPMPLPENETLSIEEQALPVEASVSEKVFNNKKPQVAIASNQKYNKSALSTVVLDDYKNKLNHLIEIDEVFLDNELTLEVLAKKMRMPMHHLTQLFNVHLGENFNQYINKFRVEYACTLLQDRGISMSIEQVAFNSGFNSKVSFNRHFKNITGNTPKEYMHTYKKK